VEDGTVTLRERDSQAQVRLPIVDLAAVVQKMSDGSQPWPSVQIKYDDKKGAAGEDDDEMDLGFGDDDDEEEEADAKPAANSRQAKAAALKAENEKKLEEAKAAALARLAKKEANQRSLCNLEIKPWEAEQDLLALFAKIKAQVVRDGLKWSENCNLVDVAFGVKKIVCTAIIPVAVSMDEIIDEMTEETFVDEIQSMNMTSMSLL
jgi:translation elongation factor EF-1beta